MVFHADYLHLLTSKGTPSGCDAGIQRLAHDPMARSLTREGGFRTARSLSMNSFSRANIRIRRVRMPGEAPLAISATEMTSGFRGIGPF